jgi:hypothetical protein
VTRIIVEIEGGLVQAIWSTETDIEAEVLDRDIPENEEDCDCCLQEIARQESAIKSLKMTDVF